jgi:hypothetical protein
MVVPIEFIYPLAKFARFWNLRSAIFLFLKLDHLNAIKKYFEYLKIFTRPRPLHSAAQCLFGPEATQPYRPTTV